MSVATDIPLSSSSFPGSDSTVERLPIVIIGAGAAGLMAAISASERSAAERADTPEVGGGTNGSDQAVTKVIILEKNTKPGVKILMSGGTRCNVTHACDARGIEAAFPRDQARFLHPALAGFGPEEIIRRLEAEGVPLKTESTGKIFPVSDRSVDVLEGLMKPVRRLGVELALSEPVTAVTDPGDGTLLVTTRQRSIRARSVIVTTGGVSYPGCGTTGDGYAIARGFGHTIIEPRPALVPLTLKAGRLADLSGITIVDVGIRVLDPAAGGKLKDRLKSEDRGSFLLAHFGLSGPAVLNVSREVTAARDPAALVVECDFLPEEPEERLDDRLRQASLDEGRKNLAHIITPALPARLVETLIAEARLDPQRKAAALGKEDRRRLVAAFKRLPVPVTGTLGFKKAEVTAGGVALAEVDPKSMRSRKHPRLFFAGEVLDLDGRIGGYNFQAAFSTGWLAGRHA
jgi:hypothetical protein